MAKDHSSLALEALLDIKQSCQNITNYINEHGYNRFTATSEYMLWRRVKEQISRVDAFRKLLFTDAKFSPILNGPLIEQLSLNIRRDVAFLSSQLCNFLQRYAPAWNHCLRDYRITESLSTLPNIKIGKTHEQNPEETGNPGQGENGFKHISACDWDHMQNLRTDFKRYIDRLVMLIELSWWSLPIFHTSSAMAQVMFDEDAAILGLFHGLSVRKMLLEPLLEPKHGMSMEISQDKVKVVNIVDGFVSATVANRNGSGVRSMGQIINRFDTHNLNSLQMRSGRGERYDLARLDGTRGQICVIEYKYWRTSSEAAQLAALLNVIHDTKSQFFPNKCEGYFFDQATNPKRIGFVSLTSRYVLPEAHLCFLSTLFSRSNCRPDLRSRLRLALNLSKSVRQLHLFGLTCGALRSNNIYFFFRPTPSRLHGESLDSRSLCDPSTFEYRKLAQYIIQKSPRLFGFEHPQSEISTLGANLEDEILSNMYRHPACYDPRYSKHVSRRAQDIYGKRLFFLALCILRFTVDFFCMSRLTKLHFFPFSFSPRCSSTRDRHLGKCFSSLPT